MCAPGLVALEREGRERLIRLSPATATARGARYLTPKDLDRQVAAVHSHVNYIVPDTQKWEQSAAYFIDTHGATAALVKNAGPGFAIP